MRTLQCFTMLYTCALPDSLQCASFKIPKLYDIFEMNSDILVLYKCKSQCKLHFTSVNHTSYFTSVKCCKLCFTSIKRDLHCALHFTLCIHLCIASVMCCKSHFTHVKRDLQNLFFLKQAYGQVRSFFLRKTKQHIPQNNRVSST